MINFALVLFAVATGIGIARLFKLLFEVRWNQLQEILMDWFDIKGGENK